MKHLKYFENRHHNNEDERRIINLSYHENEITLPIFKKFLDDHPDIDVNIQEDDRGWTPLLISINNCGFEFGKILLDRGADPNIFSDTPELGRSPYDNDTVMMKMIYQADIIQHQETDFQNKFWNFLDMLIPFTDLNKQTNIFKRTPLIKVAESVEGPNDISSGVSTINTEVALKLMRKFLKEEPILQIKDNKGYDFLDHLIKKSNYDIIKKLCNEFKSADIFYNSKKFNI